MVEMLLGNHPLDCPVCDAGGECELQDMTFKYGAAESKYIEPKNHREEQQWSPVVFFDRPRCILCYRCVRVCGEGMDVWALGVQNRGVSSHHRSQQGRSSRMRRVRHVHRHLPGRRADLWRLPLQDPPVGDEPRRHHLHPLRRRMQDHSGRAPLRTGMEIVRGDNRDKSGINGDFLCIKGRYAFDFANHEDRLTQPLIRKDGKLTPATWEEAFRADRTERSREIRDSRGGQAIGVIGSNRTTNEENYLLQKFARTVLQTNNIDHHRTADFPAFAAALAGKPEATATMRDVFHCARQSC